MNLLKKLKVRSVRKALFESGFRRRVISHPLKLKGELVPFDGKDETRKLYLLERNKYSEEDLITLANKVIAVYIDSPFQDHELYIAPGELFGSDEKFVLYSRSPEQRGE